MVRARALLVASLVVLAGCGLGPSSPADSPAGSEIAHPVELASTTPSPYQLTVTVARDGEPVYTETVTGGQAASYRQLTTLNASGTYTVTVESNITGKLGGEAGAERTLSVEGGERTTIVVNPGNVSVVQQPESPAGTHHAFTVKGREELTGPMRVIVRRDGETVFRTNVTPVGEDEAGETPVRLATFEETGTYQIMVKPADSFFWQNETFVVLPADERSEGVHSHIRIFYGEDVDLQVAGAARTRGGDDEE